MMGTLAVFPGSKVEKRALHIALAHCCTCEPESPAPCPAHAILEDGRLLNHLVFVRRCVAKYQRGEWHLEPPTVEGA